jgi:hypothetical protein
VLAPLLALTLILALLKGTDHYPVMPTGHRCLDISQSWDCWHDEESTLC